MLSERPEKVSKVGFAMAALLLLLPLLCTLVFSFSAKLKTLSLQELRDGKRRKGQDSGAEKKRKEKGRQLIRRSRRAVPLQIVKRGLTFFIDKNLPLLLLSKIEFENSTKRKKIRKLLFLLR